MYYLNYDPSSSIGYFTARENGNMLMCYGEARGNASLAMNIYWTRYFLPRVQQQIFRRAKICVHVDGGHFEIFEPYLVRSERD